MAAILDLQVTCTYNLNFYGFIGSGIVKNIYIDTKIMTLGGFLDKLERFSIYSIDSTAILAAILWPSWIYRAHACQIPFYIAAFGRA